MNEDGVRTSGSFAWHHVHADVLHCFPRMRVHAVICVLAKPDGEHEQVRPSPHDDESKRYKVWVFESCVHSEQ